MRPWAYDKPPEAGLDAAAIEVWIWEWKDVFSLRTLRALRDKGFRLC